MKSEEYDLKEDGFIFLRGFVDKKDLDLIQSYASEILDYLCLEEGSDFFALPLNQKMAHLEKKSRKDFFTFCKELSETPKVHSIANCVMSYLDTDKIIGSKTHYVDSIVFFNKTDISRLQYDWHSENSYYPNASEVLTIWFPWLHAVNNENGTMIIAKGSNKKTYTPKRIEEKEAVTQMKVPEEELAEFELVDCNLSLGDLVVFSSKVVHKSGLNKTKEPRVTMVIRLSNLVGKLDSGWK
jgi:ectoine hydroxylase-related dioxygenase (phytanoyl-CoA dioxygenase family)